MNQRLSKIEKKLSVENPVVFVEVEKDFFRSSLHKNGRCWSEYTKEEVEKFGAPKMIVENSEYIKICAELEETEI